MKNAISLEEMGTPWLYKIVFKEFYNCPCYLPGLCPTTPTQAQIPFMATRCFPKHPTLSPSSAFVPFPCAGNAFLPSLQFPCGNPTYPSKTSSDVTSFLKPPSSPELSSHIFVSITSNMSSHMVPDFIDICGLLCFTF